MFERFFRGKTPPAPPAPPRDIRALTSGFATPAIHLVHSAEAGLSHFGGTPATPEDFVWPTRAGRPLGFLARIDLEEMHRARPVDWLPSDGTLLFFYDMEEQPWGFDPKDQGGWAVAYFPASTPLVEAVASPALPRSGIAFRPFEALPSHEHDAVQDLELEQLEWEEYQELIEARFEGQPMHQMTGPPNPVQGDGMELECQLVSNGLYCGDPSGYKHPRAAELGPGAAEWKLLLQFDTDDALDVMWGDVGRLYFWVRESDARRADFSGVWLVLQCG